MAPEADEALLAAIVMEGGMSRRPRPLTAWFLRFQASTAPLADVSARFCNDSLILCTVSGNMRCNLSKYACNKTSGPPAHRELADSTITTRCG